MTIKTIDDLIEILKNSSEYHKEIFIEVDVQTVSQYHLGVSHGLDDAMEIVKELKDNIESNNLKEHYHVAGTTEGKPIDECASCGEDFRHPVHKRIL